MCKYNIETQTLRRSGFPVCIAKQLKETAHIIHSLASRHGSGDKQTRSRHGAPLCGDIWLVWPAPPGVCKALRCGRGPHQRIFTCGDIENLDMKYGQTKTLIHEHSEVNPAESKPFCFGGWNSKRLKNQHPSLVFGAQARLSSIGPSTSGTAM